MELRLPWLLNRILAEPDTGFSPLSLLFLEVKSFFLVQISYDANPSGVRDDSQIPFSYLAEIFLPS